MQPHLQRQSPQFVAIVGGSGAGKSWLATRIQSALGPVCGRLCLDDFYHDRSHLSMPRRAQLNFDHPRAIDWPLLESVLSRCQPGRLLQLPQYDFVEHRRLEEERKWEATSLVLVEGLWLLHRRSLRRLFNLSVFIDCPETLRLERRRRRDVFQRGRSDESVRRQFSETVNPMHERFVAPQARWAVVRLGGNPSASDLKDLVRRVSQLLNGLVQT